MDLYRRIAAVRTQEDADDVLDEIVDRYGEPPQGVLNLISVALLRAKAAVCGISEINQRQGTLQMTLSAIDFSAVSALCTDSELSKRILFSAGETPMLTYRLIKKEDPLQAAISFVSRYSAMMTAIPQNIVEKEP